MQTVREKFQELLKKLFQFDCAELDFGIYRIMNHKRDVIEKFIEKDLLDGVEKELSSGALAHEAGLAQQLAELAAQIKENIADDAIDAEGNLNEKHNETKLGKQYLELMAKAAQTKSRPELEALIFNHLYSFFSRYYDEGDFMALRRYSKRDKYAIPYNGEEVYLHWANSDQYYIKTAETFTDYSYKHNDWIVKFILRNAEVEQNNKKGAKRFFIPQMKDAVLTASKKTLTVPFEYRALTEQEEITYKSKPQETILAEASAKLFEFSKVNVEALSALATEKRKDTDGNPVSLIEHHLRAYTRKNTSDFFIHKDLKGFLERELDFYLKNEVLNLDELEAGGEQRTDSWFQIMHTMKVIGRKIIAFVAQIENFQKRIFEKKKFVIEVSYCITLDRIPEEFYPEIIKNKDQIEEWKRLFHIQEIEQDTTQPGYTEPLKVAFLKAQENLVLDTKFFSFDFKDRLLSKLPSIDTLCDGLLVNSENLQALNLLQRRYKGQSKCVYIDPPFNSPSTEIVYKNDYKHSSWLTLMDNRIKASIALKQPLGTFVVAIDENEQEGLGKLLSSIFPEFEKTCVTVINNPSGQQGDNFSYCHEFAYFVYPSTGGVIGRNIRDENADVRPLRDVSKGNHLREAAANCFYPILIKDEKIIGFGDVCDDSFHPVAVNIVRKDGVIEVYPIDAKGHERKWVFARQSVEEIRDELSVEYNKKRNIWDIIRTKTVFNYKTVWIDKKYSANSYGSKLLNQILGEHDFTFPKSIYTVMDCIQAATNNEDTALILDYFGGSGTTAHAVVSLNREDKGSRKYIIVELERYFNTVLKPRLQKIIYSSEWKDAKPVKRSDGISHCFKYISLESYEDALDNIAFKECEPQLALQLEDYVLSYMLEFETKESDTLLNVVKLDSPFDYKLRLHGKDEPLPVDLPETFNYLIGLYVDSRKVYDNNRVRYLVYRGKVEGRETAVIWRTIRVWGEKELKADKEFVLNHKLTEGAEDIFVNGDSFIPGARSLDPIFKQRMFTGE